MRLRIKPALLPALLALLFLSFVPLFSNDFLKSIENVSVYELVYGKGGKRDLKLTLYHPIEGDGPFPGVVFIHGGGWRAGHPGHFARQAMFLAANDYVCACIEYRLSGEAIFPAAIEDCKCAIRWLRAHAGEFHVDPEKIAASGGSAGGHLALLAGTSGGMKELEGEGGWNEFSSSVQLVVAFNPACEFTDVSSEAVDSFLGGSYQEVPDRYRRATPQTYLDQTDPPMLLLHGTEDKIVPYRQSADFVAALKALGIEAELYSEEGAGHGWFNNPPFFIQTTMALKNFLDQHFKKIE
ncbi:MAG TPA: alpha/beta hydrolase [archaeon]|nr:alpha/beta hydrolase [archaeon]